MARWPFENRPTFFVPDRPDETPGPLQASRLPSEFAQSHHLGQHLGKLTPNTFRVTSSVTLHMS